MIYGSSDAGIQRVLLSNAGGNSETKFPVVADSDLRLSLAIEFKASDIDSDGFDFTIIAVVMAPESANVTLS